MANFKTHIGFGFFVGVAFIVAGLIYSLFSSAEAMIWVFLAVLIGSFLPDLDMDEGVPVQILFGLLGLGIAGMVFLNLYQGGEKDMKMLIMSPVVIFAMVRFGAGYAFERFTNHRGIFHSVPAAILFGLLTIWLLDALSILKNYKLVLGLAVGIGYLGHLVLDEIYSSVNLHGHSLLPKKTLGSAIKLYSSSKISTFIFYALIFALATGLPESKEILKAVRSIF